MRDEGERSRERDLDREIVRESESAGCREIERQW